MAGLDTTSEFDREETRHWASGGNGSLTRDLGRSLSPGEAERGLIIISRAWEVGITVDLNDRILACNSSPDITGAPLVAYADGGGLLAWTNGLLSRTIDILQLAGSAVLSDTMEEWSESRSCVQIGTSCVFSPDSSTGSVISPTKEGEFGSDAALRNGFGTRFFRIWRRRIV